MISIIIPHFNRSRLIGETLASVTAQSCDDWEVIVVDDGSDPDERAALDGYASDRVRILDRNDGDKGPSRCRNLGAAAATGEFLLFLDSDDLLAPTCLAQRLEAAGTEPDFDLWVFPAGTFREHPGDTDKPWGTMNPGGDDAARFAKGDAPWHTSSPLWKKTPFCDLGGFNERILYGDDADLHLRALLAPLRIRQFPDRAADIFVRRSDEARITNSLDQAMIRSRQIRLEEGTQLLRYKGAPTHLIRIWEGQYIAEAEFFLFNHSPAASLIQSILSEWAEHFRPNIIQILLIKGYFSAALPNRERAYWIVRITRRIVMILLPTHFFAR